MTPPRIELGPHRSQRYVLTTRQWGHKNNYPPFLLILPLPNSTTSNLPKVPLNKLKPQFPLINLRHPTQILKKILRQQPRLIIIILQCRIRNTKPKLQKPPQRRSIKLLNNQIQKLPLLSHSKLNSPHPKQNNPHLIKHLIPSLPFPVNKFFNFGCPLGGNV